MKNNHTEISNSKQYNRVLYFDVLRILATFFVMVLHVSAQNWNSDIHTFEWNVFNVYDSISRWGVPIFVMISGALFLSRDYSVKIIFSKYIMRIVVAFIVWSAIYSFAFNIVGKHDIRAFIAGFIKGHYHMWFLYMIVGLYMIIPFLKQIIHNETLTKYFLVLGFIFAYVLPQIKSIISLISVEYGTFFGEIIDNTHFHFVLGFSTYFVFGYLLNTIEIKEIHMRIITICGIIGFISTIVFTIIASKYSNEANNIFYGINTVNVFAEAALVFVLFKRIFRKKQVGEKTVSIIKAMSKYSFGAYLTHVMIITILDKIVNLNSLTFNPALSVPIISLIVFIISFVISGIINHIPVINRYIV